MIPGKLSPGGNNIELCLDFADTVDWRTSSHPKDRILTYGDLVGWSLKNGALAADEAAALDNLVLRNPSFKEDAMKDARRLREATYRIFSAVAHGKRIDPNNLETLNEILSRGLGKMKVEAAKEGYAWTWGGDLKAEAMLYPVARSAAELLTSDDLMRVKECANEHGGCGSLFLDCSKGQTRKWCSMEPCGNRAKLRTYYVKHSQSQRHPL
jgi:predicted RNA-binding Zn ribbon-like protein